MFHVQLPIVPMQAPIVSEHVLNSALLISANNYPNVHAHETKCVVFIKPMSLGRATGSSGFHGNMGVQKCFSLNGDLKSPAIRKSSSLKGLAVCATPLPQSSSQLLLNRKSKVQENVLAAKIQRSLPSKKCPSTKDTYVRVRVHHLQWFVGLRIVRRR